MQISFNIDSLLLTTTPFYQKNRKKKNQIGFTSSTRFSRRISTKIDVSHQKMLIIVAHTRRTTDYFIPGHSFAILKIFESKGKNQNSEKRTLFFIYNPWGTDIPENMLENPDEVLKNGKYDLEFLDKENKKQIENIEINNLNDGLTLIEYSDILDYFEKFEIHQNYYSYEIISKKVRFEDLEAKFSINFSIKQGQESQKYFVFFNLFNNLFLYPQIQPYKIEKIDITPKPIKLTSYLKPNKANNMLYKGIEFENTLNQNNYTLNFELKKFNYDIVDHFFLTFYVPNNSISIEENDISATKVSEDCPENCNQNGICEKENGKCNCSYDVKFILS